LPSAISDGSAAPIGMMSLAALTREDPALARQWWIAAVAAAMIAAFRKPLHRRLDATRPNERPPPLP